MQSRMKILIDRGNAPKYSGIGIYSRNLLNALHEYGKDKVNVTDSGISTDGKDFRVLRRLQYFVRLKNLRKNNYADVDLIHFTNVYAPRRHTKTAMVSTIHDIDAIYFPESYSRAYRIYFNKIVRDVIKRADLILTDSESSRILIKTHYNIPGEVIKSIGIGVSDDFMQIADATDQSEINGIPTILFVGSLSRKKNTAWLIRQTTVGVKSGALPTMKLVLAGNAGFAFSEIAHELKEATEIVQWVQNPDIHNLVRLYKEADLIILPSRTEGFGIPLIEAMYCRKPIVASRIPSSMEVAGAAAKYFDLDNIESFYHAIKSALEDSQKQTRLDYIEKRIKNYMWSSLAPQYISVYQEAKCRH
jgi:glycosyltransferase involved in cell wall biosynthesis